MKGSTLAIVAIGGGALVLFWPKLAQAGVLPPSPFSGLGFDGLTPEQQARVIASQRGVQPGNAPAIPSAPFGGVPQAITGLVGAGVALTATLAHLFGGGAAAAAVGGGAAAGSSAGSTAAATAGGIGTAGTIAITGGIAGGALLAWGIIHEGLFRGGEEALHVSPARDKFLLEFAQFDHWRYAGNPPGFTGLANILETAFGAQRKDALYTPFLKADTMREWEPAAEAIYNALQTVTAAQVNQAKARADAWRASGSPSS